MSDAAAPAESGTVSLESYEALKRELAAKTEEVAKATARSEVFESRERARIGAWAPECREFIAGLMADADAETKSDLQPLAGWADEYANKADIVAQVPLARMVSCASKALKRTRDEASKLQSGAETLASTMKELETTKADNDALRQRVDELHKLATERNEFNEKLQKELEKVGGIDAMNNFSSLASREKNADSMALDAPLKAVTACASKNSGVSGNPLESDSLLQLITSRGSASLRMMPSNTAHQTLGSVDGTSDILRHIRGAA